MTANQTLVRSSHPILTFLGGAVTVTGSRFLIETPESQPRFTLIPHTASFFRRMNMGIGILENLAAQLPERTR